MAVAAALRRVNGVRWLVFLSALQVVTGFLVNSTIDDGFPDPRTGTTISYIPPEAWNKGGTCEACTARPSATELYNNTWHDSTFNTVRGSNDFPNTPLSASVTFSGSAIYVYCALAKTTSAPFGNSDMTFYIDGDLVGAFFRMAPGTPGYEYDVLVYQNTSIPEGQHTFTLTNGRVDGIRSLVLLDRIVYTYEDGQKPPSQIGAIVGGTLGGVAFLCIIAVGVGFWLMKRKKRTRRDEAAAVVNVTHTPLSPEGPKPMLQAVPYTLTSPTHQSPYSPTNTWTSTAPSQSGAAPAGYQSAVSGSHTMGSSVSASAPMQGGGEDLPGYYDSGSSAAALTYQRKS
ncbi:hypothetical protein BKA70DRAFT_310947 [Coprinopsis sp. MPI-PUGE-AT-0042]|nr:hypothetical protein BKA70DRAFT_310947 [Coprinopsis sp. MPI-PUGE-AT-0042]